MNYIERLDKFNHSKKYWSEVHFLRGLIMSNAKRLLDYGCGTGYCANILRMGGLEVDGFDLTEWSSAFEYTFPDGDYDAIYFMHSLAHLSSPLDTVKSVQYNLNDNGEIIIITPNRDWLEQIPDNPNYQPDPTVVQHFCQYQLERLVFDAGLKIRNSGQFGERKGNFNERLFIVCGKS